jgi:serine/threonine-protein kinase RsbT
VLRIAALGGSAIAPEGFTTRYSVLGGAYVLAGRAAAEVKQRLAESSLPGELTRRVVIAAYEAEMNICIYAISGEMTLRVGIDRVWVVAEDRGPGIPDLGRALTPGYSTAPPKARELGFGAGMGFPNMRRCADTLEVHTVVGQGTKVEMSFHPRPEDDPEGRNIPRGAAKGAG